MARTPVVAFYADLPSDTDRAMFADTVLMRLERYSLHSSFVVRDQLAGQVVSKAAFQDRGEAEVFMDWLLTRFGHGGGPTGKVSFHMCSHSLGEEPTEPCTDPAAEYIEQAG